MWHSLKSILRQPFILTSTQDPSVLAGRKHLKVGNHAGALTAFLNFYQRRAIVGLLIRRRNSNVVFDLLKLSDIYAPAKDAIVALASEIELEIRQQTASNEDISDWCTIIRHLGDFDRAWSLYNTLLEQKCENAPKLTAVVYGKLIAEQRYVEALPTAIENALWTLEEVDPAPKNNSDQVQLFTYWLPSVYEAFEVLQAANENELCKSLEQWAMTIPPQPVVYDGLINAALRANHQDVADRLSIEKSKRLSI